MMPDRLILVGSGAFARELINWVDDLVNLGLSIPVTGFLDDDFSASIGPNYSIPRFGSIHSYIPKTGDKLLMAIADPKVKKRLHAELKSRGASFTTLIHPSAVVARTAKLGEGVVICPHAFISADAVIGDLCAINGNSSVGHDVNLGSFSTLSSHVDLTGWVQVGECTFFGSGARILPKIKIGPGARIGAGSVVVRSVPDDAVVFAPPAKRLC
jgi:sugar O-acyltransferase (sialic acid O-acetyltransferase NeuD family)